MKTIHTAILDMIWNYLPFDQASEVTDASLEGFDGTELKGLYCNIADYLMDHLPEALSLEVAGKCMESAGF
jgi:hypothetical protein